MRSRFQKSPTRYRDCFRWVIAEDDWGPIGPFRVLPAILIEFMPCSASGFPLEIAVSNINSKYREFVKAG